MRSGKTKRSDFMTSDEVARWNSLYAENRDVSGQRGRWAIFQSYARRRALNRLRLCVSLVDSYDCKDVLDLACGSGHYGVVVADRGGTWIGMDISRPMLVDAKRRLARKGHDGHVVVGDIRYVPFAKNSFDVVFCVGILSYFTNREVRQILEQLPDLLRPGGYLIFETARLDVITWLRTRLPGWIPRPIRLAGPLYYRRARVIFQQMEATSVRPREVIEIRKFGIVPFQTIYLFEKERSHHE